MGERQETLAEHVARKHSRPLLSFLARKLRSDEDAKDLFQEVLAGLINIKSHRIKAPLAYAVRCAVAVLAAHYEGKKLQLVSIEEIGSEQMEGLHEDTIGAVEFGEDLLKVLRRLPCGVQRDVYIRRLVNDEPFAQIAKEMNISVQVAYNYYYSVNKKVWEMMSEQGGKGK